MVKRRRKSRSKRRRQEARYIPWIIVAIVLVLILGILWNNSFFDLFTSKNVEARGFEALAGVTGTSYDDGETTFAYPDPTGTGAGRQLLPALGDENAPVVVMEFSDLYCGHCRTFNQTSLEDILGEYVATGQVRYVDHYFGFAQAVTDGVVHAEMCAAEQGKYFEFKHALFAAIGEGKFDVDQTARDVALDMRAFNSCQRNEKYQPALEEIVFDDNMGVNATPTFFINGQIVEGNRPDEIRRLINEALVSVE